MPTGHVHAASMLLYAQDAAETPEPWLRWEYKDHAEGQWAPLPRHPSWFDPGIYRRKLKTIRIGEFDVPEPLRTALAVGTSYYVAEIEAIDLSCYSHWGNDELDQRWLERGLIHLTKDAAELHAMALISLSKGA